MIITIGQDFSSYRQHKYKDNSIVENDYSNYGGQDKKEAKDGIRSEFSFDFQ